MTFDELVRVYDPTDADRSMQLAYAALNLIREIKYLMDESKSSLLAVELLIERTEKILGKDLL